MNRTAARRIDVRGAGQMSRVSSRMAIGIAAALLLAYLAVTAASGTVLEGTPAASPAASPVASPMAAPVAHATSPSTQIIVGEITIEIYDDAIEPAHFESAVGRDVSITVVNRGTAAHNFTIDAFDIDIDLEPGETASVEITGPALGDYRYYSDLPGDEDLEGVMTVFI